MISNCAFVRVRGVRAALGAAAFALVALGAPGCAEREGPPPFSRRGMKVEALPKDVLASARKALPDIDFSEAWQNLDRGGKLTSYEVRGRTSNGKIREVRVSTTGEILEME